MELRGDEKKIQALFSEQLLEDQNIAPRFERVWNGAQSATGVRSLNRLAVALASLLIISAFASLAAWSNYKSVPSLSPVAIVTEPASPEPKQDILVSGPKRSKRPKRHRKVEHNSLEQAALLSRWQSPTQIFMTSPTALVLNSLPQLDQSVNELKQFLPKNNQAAKESNQ